MECSQPQFAVAFRSDGTGLGGPCGFRTEPPLERRHPQSWDANNMTDCANPARAVLIVENDPLLRLFMGNLVETVGFEAIQVCDADEAISILDYRVDIALLVTNVAMRST